MTTLLVGRGLLGASVGRALEQRGVRPRGLRVPWTDSDSALEVLLDGARSSADAAGHTDRGWRLVWCAGAGVVATPAEDLLAEVGVLERFVQELEHPPTTMFLTSSAGGVYAGSVGPPFTEAHDPEPISPYGHAKFATEVAARRLAARGTRVAIARCANLYGPGQDVTKPQGLISQLCLSRLIGRPLSIYVSTDTLRDYVYVEDAAAMAIAMLDRLEQVPAGTVVTKIIASGHSTSISGLVSAVTRAQRRRPLVVLTSARDQGQVRDLRLRSLVWTDLDALAHTPLVVGLRATTEDLQAQHRAARLPVFRG